MEQHKKQTNEINSFLSQKFDLNNNNDKQRFFNYLTSINNILKNHNGIFSINDFQTNENDNNILKFFEKIKHNIQIVKILQNHTHQQNYSLDEEKNLLFIKNNFYFQFFDIIVSIFLKDIEQSFDNSLSFSNIIFKNQFKNIDEYCKHFKRDINLLFDDSKNLLKIITIDIEIFILNIKYEYNKDRKNLYMLNNSSILEEEKSFFKTNILNLKNHLIDKVKKILN
jgi:hypothetical protein